VAAGGFITCSRLPHHLVSCATRSARSATSRAASVRARRDSSFVTVIVGRSGCGGPGLLAHVPGDTFVQKFFIALLSSCSASSS